MRVIRTEMYFEPISIPFTDAHNPGVAFAWFNTGQEIDLSETEIARLEFDYGSIQGVRSVSVTDDNLFDFRRILARALLGEPDVRDAELNTLLLSTPLRSAVDAILGGDIIIERSPPSAINLKDLTRNVSSASVGTYMGFAAAGDNHALLFLTVPAGIIVVGAAVGISKALEAGLNKAIARFIQQRLPPTPRRPRSR
jgi:hypothetical protein